MATIMERPRAACQSRPDVARGRCDDLDRVTMSAPCGAVARCSRCAPSCPQLVEQRLRLFQIERVEAFGEPAVDRSEKIAGLLPACPDRARAAPCSSRRGVPRILLAAGARPRARARNTLPLSPHPAPATSARFRRQCDGPRPRTTFPWLFPPPSSLRQCSAKRHRIGRVPHRLSPNMINTTASTVLLPLTAMR